MAKFLTGSLRALSLLCIFALSEVQTAQALPPANRIECSLLFASERLNQAARSLGMFDRVQIKSNIDDPNLGTIRTLTAKEAAKTEAVLQRAFARFDYRSTEFIKMLFGDRAYEQRSHLHQKLFEAARAQGKPIQESLVLADRATTSMIRDSIFELGLEAYAKREALMSHQDVPIEKKESSLVFAAPTSQTSTLYVYGIGSLRLLQRQSSTPLASGRIFLIEIDSKKVTVIKNWGSETAIASHIPPQAILQGFIGFPSDGGSISWFFVRPVRNRSGQVVRVDLFAATATGQEFSMQLKPLLDQPVASISQELSHYSVSFAQKGSLSESLREITRDLSEL